LLAPTGVGHADATLEITLEGLPSQGPPALPTTNDQRPTTNDRREPGTEHRAPSTARNARPKRNPDAVGRLGLVVSPVAVITRLPQLYLRPISRVTADTPVVVKQERPGWCGVLMIDGSIGWLPSGHVRLLDYDVVKKPGSTGMSLPKLPPGLGRAVLEHAYQYLGVPYEWGGNNASGIDCSGLVKNCFGRCGISLPRRASEQALVGIPVPYADWSNLQPGDRLYFAVKGKRIDHTGIYVGDGYFIHASMSRGRVGVDRLSRPLYRRSLVAARRIPST
jgi:hypothetical protein